ncbi:hypothetical protein HID58_078624 [Brassica napus]|uniref:Uncharacterized protein n=3 Tax=Brassica TaxID=3705 RepID=A0A8X7TF64_BRACI|nr:hypothetical protein Bca52824_092659 [Brassica carinata]KAH0871602.1 hypothetical protein HID58_078624 [Brassica napus]CAF2031838.1 unnamed protein product [Brassica napus]
MGFAAIWNSHPKKYGPGSRTCRVCGNSHGLIRKYGLNCCRQCFRSNAKEIGFIKGTKEKKTLRRLKRSLLLPSPNLQMGSDQNPSRSDTSEIKSRIYRLIGTQRANTYFHQLGRFFASRITKPEFDKLCLKTIGRQHISLHNRLIRSLIKNATVAKSPPPSRYVKKGGSFVRLSNGKQSIRRKFRDRPSPLGPLGKPQSVTTTTTSATELMSLGSRPPLEVEEGEEVEQVAGSQSVTAPLGVGMSLRRKAVSCSGFNTCQSSGELPDTRTLRSRLEMEGVKVSMDSVSLLNSGLDVFMRRLIEPCLSLASARCGGSGQQRRRLSSCVWMSDFRAGMELKPQVLGEEWPILLEKICSRVLDSKCLAEGT